MVQMMLEVVVSWPWNTVRCTYTRAVRWNDC